MIKPTVIDCRFIAHEMEYTINVDYLDGNNWEVIKPLKEIWKHRKRVSRKHQDLHLPIFSETEDFDDDIIMNKGKYEVQEYLDYLLYSEVGYQYLLELIEFSRNSRSISPNRSADISMSSSSRLGPGDRSSNEISGTSINAPEENESKIVGGSFIAEDKLFESPNENSYKDDSDEDF